MKELGSIAIEVECPAALSDALQELVSIVNRAEVVSSCEELEELEKEIRDRANRLCGRAVGLKIQQALDSEAAKEAQKQLKDIWPHPLRDKGKETVQIRTATGLEVEVEVSYFTRKGKRRGRKRYPGVYLGLLWLGIHERCTPGLAAEVSLLAAMLGSLQEATRVLAERGIVLSVKVVRQIAYRFAERARVAQRLEGAGLSPELAGRRVVVSMDGGRIRLREKKRGPRTAKGRERYKGAWREPKLFIVYVVDAEGKLERSFMPVIDALILSCGALIQDGPNILPNGHELMFATNVVGPFLFTQLLLERMEMSDGLVLHVVAMHSEDVDWDDLESIKNHKTGRAFNRTKTMNRAIAAEFARRRAGKVSSVAFDPSYIIDKDDPELAKRWPHGFMGFFWRVMTVLFAKPPVVAGEPIADLMLSYQDRDAINGALFKLNKRIKKRDKAMND